MKHFILLHLAAVAVTLGASHRSRRAAFEFADGIDEVVGQVRTTFQCPQRYGYYADVDNDCKVFHVCNPIVNADGALTEVQHFSFFCGNQTVFNQLTLTCAHPEEAVPCHNAPDFFYVNDNIGQQDAPFLTDADVEKAAPLIPGYGSTAAATQNAYSEYAASAAASASSISHHYAEPPSYTGEAYDAGYGPAASPTYAAAASHSDSAPSYASTDSTYGRYQYEDSPIVSTDSKFSRRHHHRRAPGTSAAFGERIRK